MSLRDRRAGKATRGGVSRGQRTIRAMVAGVFVLLVGAGLAAPATPAEAILDMDSCSFLPGATGNRAATTDSIMKGAADQVLPEDAQGSQWRGAGPTTRFELLRGQGQTWSTYGRTVDDEAGCNVMDQAMSGTANMALRLSDQIVGGGIFIQALATDNQGAFNDLYDQIDEPSNTIYTKIFKPSLNLAVMLVGLYAAVMAIVKFNRAEENRREMATNLVWVLGLVLLVTVMIPGGQYMKMVKATDVGVAAVTSEMTSALLSTDDNEELCSLPAGEPSAGRRTLACTMWYSMSFQPWAEGQYGTFGAEKFPYSGEDYTDGEAPDDARFQQIWTQTFTRDEEMERTQVMRAAVEGGQGTEVLALDAQYEGKQQEWDEFATHAREAAAGDDGTNAEQAAWSQSYEKWRGFDSATRLSTALNAMGSGLITTFAIVLVSIFTLGWQMVPVFLMAALVIVALAAMWPRARSLFTSWVGLFLKAYWMRLVLGLGLGFLLLFFQTLLRMNMNPFATGMYQVAVAIGVLILYKMFKNIGPSGGEIERETSSAVGQVRQSAAGATRGGRGGKALGAMAAVGAVAGGATAISKRRTAAREAEHQEAVQASADAAVVGVEEVPTRRKERRKLAVEAAAAREHRKRAYAQADQARADDVAGSRKAASEATKRAAEIQAHAAEASMRASEKEMKESQERQQSAQEAFQRESSRRLRDASRADDRRRRPSVRVPVTPRERPQPPRRRQPR